MLKRLTTISADQSIAVSEADEIEENVYGVLQELTLQAALEESRIAAPVVRPPDIWPDWSE